MKQPELGQKIVELRLEKGLTQEELVAKCNISVRTIQRIESGDVEPRTYTVKAILDALDYDLENIQTNQKDGVFNYLTIWLRNLMLIEIDTSKPSKFLIKQLYIACIFGICYFILGFLEVTAEYYRYREAEMIFSNYGYVILKVTVLISVLFFLRGFILIGGIFKNYLLKIVTGILVGFNILLIGYDIASVFYESFEREFILFAASVSFGIIGMIYGIALLRLKPSLGMIASYAGILQIIAACFFLTIILSFIGMIIIIPVELLEIILIFKAIEIIKSKEKSLLAE
ncbi:MAG: helix-turn-helix domain-containing protein [Marinifilum sp.]|jgi:transcriptional regulator with XRE-family HTH domain|nr:helix-turn-helix domain-containing protein [Marinifilum sp.]